MKSEKSLEPSRYSYIFEDLQGDSLAEFLGRTSGTSVNQLLEAFEGGEPQTQLEALKKLNEDLSDEVLFGWAQELGDPVSQPLEAIQGAELEAAASRIPKNLHAALTKAAQRIEAYYSGQAMPLKKKIKAYKSEGLRVSSRHEALNCVGIYIPGGKTAFYPSTVLMTVVPAKAAGVKEVIVCAMPTAQQPGEPKVPDVILAAAAIAGADKVFGVGGVPAVWGMAFGVGSLPRVQAICGPGNKFVANAMKFLASTSTVRMISLDAGPSEVAVILDEKSDFMDAGIDILAQLEHGPNGKAWAICLSEAAVEGLNAALKNLLNENDFDQKDPEVKAYLVKSPAAAVEVANCLAPEHLQIMCDGGEALAEQVQNAGAIFVGKDSPAALGDYVAGPSHVLPTSGAAEFSGALDISNFMKKRHIVSSRVVNRVVFEAAVDIAEAEGFTWHARSLKARLRNLKNQENKKGGQGV